MKGMGVPRGPRGPLGLFLVFLVLSFPAFAAPPPVFATECAHAEQGDVAAALRVARRLLFGMGVRKDHRMGVAWLRAAASRGNLEARRMLMYIPVEFARIHPVCRPGAGPLRPVGPPPAAVVQLVQRLAPVYGLDPALVLAVIQVESAYRSDALSPKEAAGLMQLIPDTADRFGVTDVFDAEQNVRGGMKYLRWLLSYFRGSVPLALAGYNAGEKAVDRFGGIPPFAETMAYVRLIRQLYPGTRHAFDPSLTDASPVAARSRDPGLP